MDFKTTDERAKLQMRVNEIERQQKDLQYQIDNLESQRKELLRKITSITPQDEQQILLSQLYEQRHKGDSKRK